MTIVHSVWGSQQFCMQQQSSSQATSMLATPNLYIGSYIGMAILELFAIPEIFWNS